jgi:hypothetical protein
VREWGLAVLEQQNFVWKTLFGLKSSVFLAANSWYDYNVILSDHFLYALA